MSRTAETSIFTDEGIRVSMTLQNVAEIVAHAPAAAPARAVQEWPAPAVRPSRMQRYQRWIALVLAAVTFGSGVVNLYSVMGGPSHPRWLAEIFPLEFFRLSRTLTVLIGFALVISSINVYRRKARAWWIVLGLSSFAIVFQMARTFDYQEALFSAALLVMLLATRRIFTVKSSIPDVSSTTMRLAAAVTVALAYGIAGFWFLDPRHFGINFHIGDAIVTTLQCLSFNTRAGLVPKTSYGVWFLDSLYLVAISAALYSGLALFQPVIYQLRTLPRERALARDIIARHGRTSLDYFKTWNDKSFYFSPSHQSFIAYAVGKHTALALGDPVGPEAELGALIKDFMAYCRDNGWSAGFHQTLPDLLPVYRRAGLKKLKVGDDAVVDLKSFSLEGRARKEFRYKIKQLEALGIRTVELKPPLTPQMLAELKAVSDEWLRIPGRRERRFTLGLFSREYVGSTPVLAAVNAGGEVLGFVNLIAIPARGEMSVDLMRRRTDAPNGIMDYLFVKVFLHAKENGYERFNLGMAPMAGFQEREEATPEERAIHSFFQQLNFLFSFRGLRQYKAKFATHWEPRYLVYRNVLELPRLAMALRRVSEVRNDESEMENQD